MNASTRIRLGRWSAIMLFAAILMLLPTFASAAPVSLDFDTDAAGAPIVPGQIIDDEWNTPAYGNLVVSTTNPTFTEVVAFNSSAPTGGDTDLGSPNETCPGGGPGISGDGSGGPGSPYPNCIPLGNLIIIEENCGTAFEVGGVIDYGLCGIPGPDDSEFGGTVNFTFGSTASDQVTIDAFELLDFEDAAGDGGVTVNAYDATGALIFTFAGPAIGDNGSAVVDLGFDFAGTGNTDPLPWPGVSRLEFVLEGSGSVGTLSYDTPTPTAIALDSFGIRADVTYYGIVAVLMLGALSFASMALFRRQQVAVEI